LKKKKYPLIGVIIMSIVLLLINRYTETSFAKDYAILFIMVGLFLGLRVEKYFSKKNEG